MGDIVISIALQSTIEKLHNPGRGRERITIDQYCPTVAQGLDR